MLNFIKKNLFIVIIFFITLLLGFVTFLTFLDKSFIKLNDQNLQYLLLSNIVLLIIFFLFIFLEVKNSIKSEIVVEGSKANRKYIAFFSLFTLIPSILISAFSLFLFSFAVEKYFDKEIITPGIRLSGDSKNDQKRTMSPKEAFQSGASAIVMGRSLIKGNIKKNIQKLIRELN